MDSSILSCPLNLLSHEIFQIMKKTSIVIFYLSSVDKKPRHQKLGRKNPRISQKKAQLTQEQQTIRLCLLPLQKTAVSYLITDQLPFFLIVILPQ